MYAFALKLYDIWEELISEALEMLFRLKGHWDGIQDLMGSLMILQGNGTNLDEGL